MGGAHSQVEAYTASPPLSISYAGKQLTVL